MSTVVNAADVLAAIVRHVRERLQQHERALALWEKGFLTPTEPDASERDAVVRELRAAIAELKKVAEFWET